MILYQCFCKVTKITELFKERFSGELPPVKGYDSQELQTIEAEIAKLIDDDKRIKSLFSLEKDRRALDDQDLVFIGIANFSSAHHCLNQAFLKCKDAEVDYFKLYLRDRLSYSYRLGIVDEIPENVEKVLAIGDNITHTNIETLLKEKAEERERKGYEILPSITFTDENGSPVVVINPDIPKEDQERIEIEARSKGTRIADLRKHPDKRGLLLESTRAEKYPSIRWNFHWGKYVIAGIPDGITADFVYEFKSIDRRQIIEARKRHAFVQGDVYGLLFKKKMKRIHVDIFDESKAEIFQVNVDKANALRLYRLFLKVDTGWIPRAAPEWKCARCDYLDECVPRKREIHSKKW